MLRITFLTCNLHNRRFNLQLVTIQKEEIPRISSFCIISEELFLSVFHVVLVTVHELVNTSCSVDQFNFTGIERV